MNPETVAPEKMPSNGKVGARRKAIVTQAARWNGCADCTI
jgi:hypothetical protein